MLAYPYTLEDVFQRLDFTRQRFFVGTGDLDYQRALVPSTIIPSGVPSFENKKILP